MKLKYILRITFAASLALLVGFGLFAEHASAKPKTSSNSMQFRSTGRYDGSILEYEADSWIGGRINSGGRTIFVGDDSRRRASLGILDFDTSSLPDDAYVTAAYLQLRVTSFPTRFGNPYTTLGELYADVMPDYYGNFPRLEADPLYLDPTGETGDDFNSVTYDSYSFGSFDYFTRATRSGDTIIVNLWDGIYMIDPYTERTQVAVYFMFGDDGLHICYEDPGCNDNGDSLSQGLSFASGNNILSKRPLLTIFYDYP
jgi:hypothetical protein